MVFHKSLEASGKNRTFLYSLTRFNMADYKQRVPKLIGESADQHLPPLKEKKIIKAGSLTYSKLKSINNSGTELLIVFIDNVQKNA